MSGLFLLFTLVLWFVFVVWLAGVLVKPMQPGLFAGTVQFMLALLLLIVPIADELIGKLQFNKLCKTDALAQYDKTKALNKTVNLKEVHVRKINNAAIPIREEIWEYIDAINQEKIITFTYYYATGGWISRTVNFNSVNSPYTFNGVCAPLDEYETLKMLNIKKVDKLKGELN